MIGHGEYNFQTQRFSLYRRLVRITAPCYLHWSQNQSQWQVVRHDILRLVDSFFSQGTLDPDLNRTHIALIPKVAQPDPRCSICNQHPETVEHLFVLCSLAVDRQSKAFFAEILWQIRKARKAMIFQARRPNLRLIFEDATTMNLLYINRHLYNPRRQRLV